MGIVYPDQLDLPRADERGLHLGSVLRRRAGPLSTTLDWKPSNLGVHTVQALYDALDQGTLPNVVFLDGDESVNDVTVRPRASGPERSSPCTSGRCADLDLTSG